MNGPHKSSRHAPKKRGFEGGQDMIQHKQVGDYRLMARAEPTDRGYIGSVMVARLAPDGLTQCVMFVDRAVGRGFVFGNAQAALGHAIEVGYRAAATLIADDGELRGLVA